MESTNILYEFTIGLFFKFMSLVDVIYNFLFQEITIGDWTFSLWTLLSGSLITVLLIAWFIKKLVPVA